MYSLVSPSQLVTALVGHRTAIEVVDVLDQALRLDGRDIANLAARNTGGPDRDRAWQRVSQLAGLGQLTNGGAEGQPIDGRVGTGAALTGQLTHSPSAASEGEGPSVIPAAATPSFGSATGAAEELDLAQLLECLREEVLGWARQRIGDLAVQTDPSGVGAVTDAIGAAWAGGDLPVEDRDQLLAPWRDVYGEIPSVAPADAYGPHSSAVRQLLDTLASSNGETLAQLGEAYRLQAPARPSGVRPWDVAMRRACQAAFVTGKVRQVAAAQFAAVRAQTLPMNATGLGGSAIAGAVAHAVAGTVQAVTMRDTLDPVVFRFLVFSWEASLGPVPA